MRSYLGEATVNRAMSEQARGRAIMNNHATPARSGWRDGFKLEQRSCAQIAAVRHGRMLASDLDDGEP